MKNLKKDERLELSIGKLISVRNRRRTVTALLAVMMLELTACGSASTDKSASYFSNGASPQAEAQAADYLSDMEYGYDMKAEPAAENYDSGSLGSTAQRSDGAEYSAYYEDRKLIRTVNLDVETKEFDSLLASIEQQVNSLGGYIEKLNTYNGSRYSSNEPVRYSNMTVRIPKKQLDGFVNAVSEAANVISRSENVEDVTLAYVDMEGRRNSLKTEQERLQVLLEQADNLEDILILEDRLSTVRYQLESMESQLRTYDNKVDFATVYMSIEEVKELTPVEVKEETVGERIANGFMDNLDTVGRGIVNLFVFIVVFIPYWGILALVVIVIIGSIRMIDQHNNRVRQEKYRKQQENNAESLQEHK